MSQTQRLTILKQESEIDAWKEDAVYWHLEGLEKPLLINAVLWTTCLRKQHRYSINRSNEVLFFRRPWKQAHDRKMFRKMIQERPQISLRKEWVKRKRKKQNNYDERRQRKKQIWTRKTGTRQQPQHTKVVNLLVHIISHSPIIRKGRNEKEEWK